MAKRKRTNAGTPVVVNVGGPSRGAKKSTGRYARGLYERRTYPLSQFYRQYMPRTAESRAAFGPSYSAATPEQRAMRAQHRMVGAGAYSVGRNWRRFAQDVGLVPAAKRIVSSGAAAIGAGLLGGMGAYSNSLVNSGDGVPDEVPMFSSAADETGAVTVTRREYIGEIVPTVANFEAHSFDINPGLSGTFKWLSQIARNYEEYDLLQCVFTYNSTMTDIGASTSGQCGTIVMATQYNVSSPEFGDKATMAVHDGAMSCKTTESMVHGIECDDAKRSGSDAHYIRMGTLGAGGDYHDYDHARFTIATCNIPQTNLGLSVGELWVSYTVVLRKPRLAAAEAALRGDLFVANAQDTGSGNAFGLDANVLMAYGNTLGGSLTCTNNQIVYIFPDDFTGPVEFRLRYDHAILNGTVTTPISMAWGSGISPVNDVYAASTNGSGDSPGSGYQTSDTVSSGAGIVWEWVRHLHVAAGASVAQRTVTVTYNTAEGIDTWAQAIVQVCEYFNPASTKSLAMGPLATRTDDAILINRSGVVVDV